MKKYTVFLKNLLNPPAKIKAGQVWKAYTIKVLIVDDKYVNKGTVRVMAVSDLSILNDGIDVILPQNDKTRFGDYTTLRVTQCAIPISALDLFIEEIEPELFDKVKSILPIQDFDYSIDEMKIINLYIEILKTFKK